MCRTNRRYSKEYVPESMAFVLDVGHSSSNHMLWRAYKAKVGGASPPRIARCRSNTRHLCHSTKLPKRRTCAETCSVGQTSPSAEVQEIGRSPLAGHVLVCALRDRSRRRRYFLLKVESTEAQVLRQSKGVGRETITEPLEYRLGCKREPHAHHKFPSDGHLALEISAPASMYSIQKVPMAGSSLPQNTFQLMLHVLVE